MLMARASIAFISAPVFAAGIVVDGGTATTVGTAANGHQTVSLAPAVSGVSTNTYSSFSVGAAGADLNNVGVNARTIINQVTSTNPSVIAGQLAVVGPRANVILANPNGVTVNGGSFVNTGHLLVTTGQVSFNSTQNAITVNTGSGLITVGPNGLESTLIALDLVAKNILIEGPVKNDYTDVTASVRTIGGSSAVTLNAGFSPTDNGNDWLTLSNAATPKTSTSFAVDITAAGSLTSGGRVELIATDAGVGVRSAGLMTATLGDFTLTSAGAIQISNTLVMAGGVVSLQSQQALSMSGSTVRAGSANVNVGGELNIGGTNVLTSGGIDVSGNSVEIGPAEGMQSTIASANSGVVLASTGDLTNLGGLVQGEVQNGADAASLGAVTLKAGGSIVNRSLPGQSLAVLFGANGDVSLTAGGNITNENARILSNQALTVNASGNVNNIVDHSTGVNDGAVVNYANDGSRFLFLTHRNSGFNVDYGALADVSQLSYITAESGSVVIAGQNVNNVGGSILSNGGDIAITATQALMTQGVFTGVASYQQSCFIFCHSHASSNVQAFGGVIEAANNVDLKAGTQITNSGGTVLAENTLTLDAPKTLAQAVLGYSAFNNTHELKAWFGNEWSAIYASDTGGIFTGGTGQVDLTGESDIDGGAFNAPNGVHAAGGIVVISAPYRAPMAINHHNHVGLVSWFGL